ncbi:hypothetical protein O181_125117 [Austropuccinia psidii MF-1]|uniref:Uncharacterized protein n=1 Tax=Austropuccinia psidii MF-1 TaxID=1389203 RepID=A0A9Q3KQW1_9BASI|nr:hypothetical protein [Austropuccinia psidii MF-1]
MLYIPHRLTSKLTELTEYSPSELPLSVLCGSGVLMEVLDPACTECLAKGKDCFEHYNTRSSKFHYCYIGKKPCHQTGRQVPNVRRYLWSKKDGTFGKEFPVSEAPTPDATSGYSALTGSRKRDVARWTNVRGPLPVGDAEGGEEAEVVPISAGHPVNYSPSHTPAKRLQSHIIHNTPRNLQPTLATIPPASPNPSHTRPALNKSVRPSPIPHPRNSPMVTSQQPQPVASTSRRREELSPLLFPAAQLFQSRDQWPIQVTRGDPNMASENQDSVARLFRRVDRNSRQVIMYANDRIILGTSEEEMAETFSWYEDELINDFQRTFDDLGRDN